MSRDTEDPKTSSLTLLRDLDRDRYLACLLSPADKREDLAALYAFAAELARVRDVVKEPLPGEIRLQYWRDLLSGTAHGATEANPLAAQLLKTIEARRLPRAPMIAMIDARLFDLYDDPMENRGMLEGYAGETASVLIQLASLILDPAAAVLHTDRAGHAGIAQTIAGIILLMPLQRRRGQVYLPADLLQSVGLDRESFLTLERDPRLDAAIEALIGLGREHLSKARGGARLAASLMPAYLPVTLCEPVFRKAARLGARVLDEPVKPGQFRRQLQMMMALVRQRF